MSSSAPSLESSYASAGKPHSLNPQSSASCPWLVDSEARVCCDFVINI